MTTWTTDKLKIGLLLIVPGLRRCKVECERLMELPPSDNVRWYLVKTETGSRASKSWTGQELCDFLNKAAATKDNRS
jgi:hypothetical protein